MSTLHSATVAFIGTINNPRTAKSYAYALAQFEKIAPCDLANVDETLLMPFSDFLSAKGAATRDLGLSAVISFFSYLVYARQTSTVNLDRARLIKKKLRGRAPVRISDYPMAELQKVIDYAGSLKNTGGRLGLIALRDRALLMTLATTGLRRAEAVSLKLRDLDLKKGQAVVIGKGDKQAVVYFSPAALAAVKDYIEARQEKDPDAPLFTRHWKGGKAWTREARRLDGSSVNKLLKQRAREALGYDHPHLGPHSLRHFFVTSVWRATHDLALARELARHSNPAMTMRYCHIDNDQLRDAHKEIFK